MPEHIAVRLADYIASRNGVPLEIISKVILRQQDLKTTQVYLGKVYGGNKVRKLEFILGNAINNNVTEVITFGFAGSNHCTG